MATDILISAILFLIVALAIVCAKWRRQRKIIKYLENTALDSGQAKITEDYLDTLFIQLLQWRLLSSEYNDLLTRLLNALDNKELIETFGNLSARFKRLHEITETDRKQYMLKVMNQSDYMEALQGVVDFVADRIAAVQKMNRQN